MNYDCEAIYFEEGQIHLVTKSRQKPWEGMAYIYPLPTIMGKYIVEKEDSIFIGNRGWMKDCVTGIDFYKGNRVILTYNRIIQQNIAHLGDKKRIHHFRRYSQKEAIVQLNDTTIYVANEKKRFLGGPYLIKIRLK